MTEKLMEHKWMIAVFLLIVPSLMRCFDLLTEGGLLTAWLVVANGYFIASVTQTVMTKKAGNDTAD
jgi:hypothetical protein